MSRLLAALASFGLAVLGLLILFSDHASACSRAGGVTAKQVVEDALSDSDYIVFSGEVVTVKSIPESRFTANLRVSEVWKGPEQGTLEVNTDDPAFCGTPFKEGQEYLVYAFGKEEPFKVDDSATKPLSKAGADLELLGDGEKPTDGGDALNDTSGVVPARAMIGLAGLVMAVSFLVMLRLVRTG